jgi:hypothetical protein
MVRIIDEVVDSDSFQILIRQIEQLHAQSRHAIKGNLTGTANSMLWDWWIEASRSSGAGFTVF